MDSEIYAYLAGAMDSDGSFGIKKNTYGVRVRQDAKNPTYNERIAIKQVTPHIPTLMKEIFGGYLRIDKRPNGNYKPLYSYQATNKIANKICASLLPYLRIKRPQAEKLIELAESKKGKYKKASYWFLLDYPEWQKLELLTYPQVAEILRYNNFVAVGQAVSNGTLIALPYDRMKVESCPRVPRLLVERLMQIQGDEKHYSLPPQLLEWKERLFLDVKELNKIGVNGTPIYYRKGVYKPK